MTATLSVVCSVVASAVLYDVRDVLVALVFVADKLLLTYAVVAAVVS